jgi:hypothetical protein
VHKTGRGLGKKNPEAVRPKSDAKLHISLNTQGKASGNGFAVHCGRATTLCSIKAICGRYLLKG